MHELKLMSSNSVVFYHDLTAESDAVFTHPHALLPVSARRPFDQTKSLIAAILGVPALAGLVYLMLVAVNVAWRDYGLAVGAVVFVLGFVALSYGAYRAVELVRSAGGR